MCQANFFGNDYDGTSFEAIFGFKSTSKAIAFDCCFCIRLLLLGSQGGPSSLEASPDSMDCWNHYTKLGPFFLPYFNHNFQPNDNQTFLVYTKSTLVLYRKGLCGFFQFWDSPWKKIYMKKVLWVLRTRGSITY